MTRQQLKDKYYLIMKAWLSSESEEKVKHAQQYFNKLNKK